MVQATAPQLQPPPAGAVLHPVSELWFTNQSRGLAIRFLYNHRRRITEMTVAELNRPDHPVVRNHRMIRRSTARDMAKHLQASGWDLCAPCW